MNSGSVLTLDNATISYNLSECYTIAVADCSEKARFSVQVKKINNVIVSITTHSCNAGAGRDKELHNK